MGFGQIYGAYDGMLETGLNALTGIDGFRTFPRGFSPKAGETCLNALTGIDGFRTPQSRDAPRALLSHVLMP